MLQTQATDRAAIASVAPCAPVPSSAAASNQDRLAASGLTPAEPGPRGTDLFTTLPLLGDMAAVVLAAMPAPAALPLAVAFKDQPFVFEWLCSLEEPDLAELAAADAEAFYDLLLAPGTTLEATFAAKIAIVCGVAVGGTWRIRSESAHAAHVGYSGRLGALATAGAGGSVGYEGGDRTGASVGVEGQAFVGAEIEWTLDPLAWVLADVDVVRALLAGRLPDAEGLGEQIGRLEPTTLLAELGGQASGNAGVGGVHVEMDVLGRAPVSEADAAGLGQQAAQAGVNLLGALYSGAFAAVKGEARVSAGFDGEGPRLAVDLSRSGAASLYGLDGHDELGVHIEVREGEPGMARGGDMPIRGTLELAAANDDDRTTTRLSWESVMELESLGARLQAPERPAADLGAPSPGELVVSREHRVDDPGKIEDLMHGSSAPTGMLRMVAGHAELRYDAEVSVRMGEDTSAAYAGLAAADEDQARDRQRALAALILGESFATEAPIYAAGAQDCASLDGASITYTAEVGAAISGEVGVVAAAEAALSGAARHKHEQEISETLGIADVARLLQS